MAAGYTHVVLHGLDEVEALGARAHGAQHLALQVLEGVLELSVAAGQDKVPATKPDPAQVPRCRVSKRRDQEAAVEASAVLLMLQACEMMDMQSILRKSRSAVDRVGLYRWQHAAPGSDACTCPRSLFFVATHCSSLPKKPDASERESDLTAV